MTALHAGQDGPWISNVAAVARRLTCLHSAPCFPSEVQGLE